MSVAPDLACPFDDCRGYIDPHFRQRLRALVDETNGFLYRCEETSQIVFAPVENLDRIWGHRDHLAGIGRHKLFGFFHDATRPNFTMKAPTKEEDRLMAIIHARSAARQGWRARLIDHLKHWLR